MTGIIYLRTDRFEVKLEGITFKVKDFESLSTLDFLFPDGKIRSRPQVVGIDIICHPRDHNAILLLLCIGVGCMILRLRAGEFLPNPILKFLTDERTRFVGFGLLKKSDLFPYDELGLARKKVDIRYLAATRLNDSTYKRSELKELSRKVLGIKRMTGVTDASSFERHERIKCAICQLFITTAIGMKLLSKKNSQKLDDPPKIMSFFKSLNSLPMFSEGCLKFPKVKKENKSSWKIANCKDDVALQGRLKESNVVNDNDINLKMRVKEEKFVKKCATITLTVLTQSCLGRKFINDVDDGHLTDFGLTKASNCVKDDVSLNNKERENYSSDNSSKEEIYETPKRHLKDLSGVDGLLDDNLNSSKVTNCVKDGVSLSTKDGNDNIGSPKVIDGNKDGIYLSSKGGEYYPIDDSSKHTFETPKRPLEGLSSGDSSHDDNFGWAKLKKIIKDGVSFSAKGRENYSSDCTNKDTQETPKRPLEDLSTGDSSHDDNFSWTRLKNLVKDGVSLSTKGGENNSSDDSSKDNSPKRPLKGILKRSSRVDLLNEEEPSPQSSFKEPITPQNQLRRANSKGLNVSFAFKLLHH